MTLRPGPSSLHDSSINCVGDPDINPTDDKRKWQMLTEDREEQQILLVQIGNGRFWRHRYHQCQNSVILNVVSSILGAVYYKLAFSICTTKL